MRRLRLGRLHLCGPDAWPDHVLSYETGSLLCGLAAQVRGYVLGFELHGKGTNPWLGVYLGPWAFEAYYDLDASWGPA